MSQKKPEISIIAALGTNTFAIGRDNQLLWHIPEDLKHFKKITGNYPLIMGRKTFESMGSRSLKGFFPSSRRNFVITRNPNFKAERCEVCSSLEEALQKASSIYRGDREIFIIGGAQLYNQAFPFTHNLYLTFVNSNEKGDTFFPKFDEKIIVGEPLFLGKGEHKGILYTFIKIRKKVTEFPWKSNQRSIFTFVRNNRASARRKLQI